MNLLAHPRLAAWPRNSREGPSFAQCLTLAALVHLLAVLLVGTVPGASSSRGEGLWGSLSVTLRGLRTEPGAGAPQPDTRNGPVGRALQPRTGGAVRDREAAPTEGPGAAREAPWQPAEANTPAAAAPAPTEPAPPLVAPDPDPPAPAELVPPLPAVAPRSEPLLTTPPPLEAPPLVVPRIDPVPVTPRAEPRPEAPPPAPAPPAPRALAPPPVPTPPAPM